MILPTNIITATASTPDNMEAYSLLYVAVRIILLHPFNLTLQSSKSIKSSIYLICLEISCHSNFYYLREIHKIIKSQTTQPDAVNHNAQVHPQSSYTYIICTFL